jgi:hypothetical protein
MAKLDLQQVHKTVCKYCGGKPKQSLVPSNFVCGACKKFCEQQLSGEELSKRDNEVFETLAETGDDYSIIENKFLQNLYDKLKFYNKDFHVSHQQYLSVCRILRKTK